MTMRADAGAASHAAPGSLATPPAFERLERGNAQTAARATALCVLAVTTAAMVRMTPTIGADAVYGLLASEQMLQGRGNRLTEIVIADPARLDQDVRESITWWAPGHQYLVHQLRRLALPPGSAVKAVVLGTWSLGILAWSALFWRALDHKRLVPWVIAAFTLFRASHANGFTYAGGETVLWGVLPGVALLNLVAHGRRGAIGVVLAFTCGLLAVALVAVKYSGAVLSVGFGVCWLWGWHHRRIGSGRLVGFLVGVAAGGSVATATGLLGLLAGITPASAELPRLPAQLVWALVGPLLSLADAPAAAGTLARGAGVDPIPTAAIGLLGIGLAIVLTAWLLAARASGNLGAPQSLRAADALRLGASITATTGIVLFVLLLRGADINWDSRHHQYGAFLLMPSLVDGLRRTLTTGAPALRGLTTICVALFVGVPTAYGAGVMARNLAVHTPALAAATGPAGIPLEWAKAGAGARALIDELSAVPGFESALVATVSPRTALVFADHRIAIVDVDASGRVARLHGRPAGAVALLAPPDLRDEGVRDLQSAFVDVREWKPVPLTSVPSARLWMGR